MQTLKVHEINNLILEQGQNDLVKRAMIHVKDDGINKVKEKYSIIDKQ